MAKQTARNNALLAKAKTLFNAKIYQHISGLVNSESGLSTLAVINWISMQYRPEIREQRRQEWLREFLPGKAAPATDANDSGLVYDQPQPDLVGRMVRITSTWQPAIGRIGKIVQLNRNGSYYVEFDAEESAAIRGQYNAIFDTHEVELIDAPAPATTPADSGDEAPAPKFAVGDKVRESQYGRLGYIRNWHNSGQTWAVAIPNQSGEFYTLYCKTEDLEHIAEPQSTPDDLQATIARLEAENAALRTALERIAAYHVVNPITKSIALKALEGVSVDIVTLPREVYEKLKRDSLNFYGLLQKEF